MSYINFLIKLILIYLFSFYYIKSFKYNNTLNKKILLYNNITQNILDNRSQIISTNSSYNLQNKLNESNFLSDKKLEKSEYISDIEFSNLVKNNTQNISEHNNSFQNKIYNISQNISISISKNISQNISQNMMLNISSNKVENISDFLLKNVTQDISSNFSLNILSSFQMNNSNFNISQNIININNSLINQKIAIAYALDDNYFYPTLVSITSILKTSKNSTYNIFYILTSNGKFSEENKKKLKNLETKYKNCKFNILEIDENLFVYAKTDRYPKIAYFRLLLAELVPDFNRIIYLDGDTLIYTDLSEMMNLNMDNNIAMGWVDNGYRNSEKFNITTHKYITSGVILFDLEKMRKENITKQFMDFLKNNYNELIQEDQTVINIVLHKRIGLLPPKYGIWAYNNREALIDHNHYRNKTLHMKCYDDNEVIKAWLNPGIAHYVQSKPWKRRTKYSNIRYRINWWTIAKATGEFDNIKNFYKIRFP